MGVLFEETIVLFEETIVLFEETLFNALTF